MANAVSLPQAPGWYLWRILDLTYLEVGAVQVLADSPKHVGWLRERAAAGKGEGFFLYENAEGVLLTMYFGAAPHHLPSRRPDGSPAVDGYVPFDFWWLVGSKPPTFVNHPEGEQ